MRLLLRGDFESLSSRFYYIFDSGSRLCRRHTSGLRGIVIFLFLTLALPAFAGPYTGLRRTKVLTSTYWTHKWSETGRYRQVSKDGRRLGEYIACNFLPSGTIVMIPALFKTSKLEVADTFGGTGVGYWKGKKYWKIDILRDKNEWIDDFDHPLDLYVVKYNHKGKYKNEQVRKNSEIFLRQSEKAL